MSRYQMSSTSMEQELNKNRTCLKKFLRSPQGDAVSFTLAHTSESFTRFANNAVNRENGSYESAQLTVTVDHQGRQGSVMLNDLSEAAITAAIERAHEIARLLPVDPEYMPPITAQEWSGRAANALPELAPFQDEEKFTFLKETFAQLEAEKLNSAGIITNETAHVCFLNSHGVECEQRSARWNVQITAMSENSSFKSVHHGTNWQDFDQRHFVRHLIEMTHLSKAPQPMAPGKYTAILSPKAVADLLSMYLWYNCGAKAIDEGRTALAGKVGQKIGSAEINIFSQPGYARAPGSPFNSNDGMPYPSYSIIKDGVFTTPLASRYYAHKKNLVATGQYPSNLIMAGADKSLDQLLAQVENGIYINGLWYIRLVDLMDGIFTGMTRDGLFAVQQGKLVHGLKNFRFNQSIPELMNNILARGEEVALNERTSFPYLLVRDFNLSSMTDF